MKLHYFAAVRRTGSAITEDDIDGWAEPGEPVVPNIPTGTRNVFIGLQSFKVAPYAEVTVGTFNPDLWLVRMQSQFPGLPCEFHEAYLMETIKIALKLRQGTLVQLYTDADTARIKVVDSDDIYTLWSEQPIPARYRYDM
jgi:hypothetical protein